MTAWSARTVSSALFNGRLVGHHGVQGTLDVGGVGADGRRQRLGGRPELIVLLLGDEFTLEQIGVASLHHRRVLLFGGEAVPQVFLTPIRK